MTHTFVSLTNTKVAREKTVEGHSTQSFHQERSTYPPGGHCGDLGACVLRLLVANDRRGGGYMHSREATVAQSQTVATVMPLVCYKRHPILLESV